MNLNLLTVIAVASSASVLSAAPQVDLIEPRFMTDSSSTARDAMAVVSDLDGPNTGNNWADAAQNSFTDVWMADSASANAWSATDANRWEDGFYAWGYARSMGNAAAGEESFARANGFAEVTMIVHEASILSGRICFMGDAELDGSEALCVIERVGGYYDDEDDEVVYLWSEMCNPDLAPCPLECLEFDIPVEPGEYRFWGSAVSNSINIGDGYHEGWAEFSAEINVRGLPRPDIDDDGRVNGNDLAMFLGGWGSSKEALDFNADQQVNGLDLAILLGAWTG